MVPDFAQGHTVDRPMKKTIQNEDTQTVFGISASGATR